MLKIEDFHALLTSDSEENALLAALRAFTERDPLEFLDALKSANLLGWYAVER